MKINESPATKAAPARAIDCDAGRWAIAAASPLPPPAAARTPSHEWGEEVLAPRYARYAGTSGRTHGETNDARPARKASAGLTPVSTRSPTVARPAQRWRRRSATTPAWGGP